MAFDQDIADVWTRIGKAEADRDYWHRAKRQDKYYEAYFLLNALEVQLHGLQRQKLEAAIKSSPYVHPLEVAVASPGPIPSSSPRASLS